MMSNKSMAVWCAPRRRSAPTSIEAHFNYWRVAGDAQFRKTKKGAVSDFIEIGVMVDDLKKIDRLYIYLPQAFGPQQISDCSGRLASPNIAQGIFNEVLTTTAPVLGGPHCVVLHKAGGVIFCRVHSFTATSAGIDSSELAVAPADGGTLLSITRAAINQGCKNANPLAPTYFRLRVDMGREIAHNPFVRIIPTPDRVLQSGFDEIEYLDFRMNEARTLPSTIETQMGQDRARGGLVSLRLVAFLTAVPVRSELSVSNTTPHKMRVLEHHLWSDYVPGGIPDGMVVYHWKRDDSDGPITDFSAFVKLQTRRSGRRILLTYLAVAFLFGVLGNLAASELGPALSGGWNAVFGSPPATTRGVPAPSRASRAIAPQPDTVGNKL